MHPFFEANRIYKPPQATRNHVKSTAFRHSPSAFSFIIPDTTPLEGGYGGHSWVPVVADFAAFELRPYGCSSVEMLR